MYRRLLIIAALACAAAANLSADFTYEQQSKVTGGMMAGMMRVAGIFSKDAREPMKTTVIVKGDRMATVSRNNIQVVDLGKESITDIDLQRKSYSVVTFAEMAEAMRRLADKANAESAKAKAKAQAEGKDVDLNFTANVKNTGQTKLINGFNTSEQIMTIEMAGTDAKSGETGAMSIVMDMWMAPKVAGYEEVINFQRRMAGKLSYSLGGGMMGAMMARPEMVKGFAAMAKEMAKLDGIPIVQVMKMGAQGTVQADGSTGQQTAAAQPQQPMPSASEAAGGAAAGAAAGRLGKVGRLGGLAGGFGGFGRKKKEEQPEQAQQQAPPPQQGQPQQASATFLEMTTELTAFSQTADTSKFDVPAGFKQVENPLVRQSR